jgi:hypothetical protein
MSKAEDLREVFLAEFGEAATRPRTGALLGFEQPAPEADPEPEIEPEEE